MQKKSAAYLTDWKKCAIFAVAQPRFPKQRLRKRKPNHLFAEIFDRKEEIATLQQIQKLSFDNAQFTVVTGRRRAGKTHLVWKAYEGMQMLYFEVFLN